MTLRLLSPRCDTEVITVTKMKLGVTLRRLLSPGEAGCDTEVITVTKVKLGATLRRLLSPR